MFVFIFHNTFILVAALRLEMRLRESIVKLIMISNQEHQDGGGAEGFRNRGDLCMVHALEWALRAVLKDDSFQIPDEFWQARTEGANKATKTNRSFNETSIEEGLLKLFQDLQEIDNRLQKFELVIVRIEDVLDLLNIVGKGKNVIVISATNETPNVYHLGQYNPDLESFVSGQQTTPYSNLAAQPIQNKTLKIAVIKPKGESLGLIFEK